MQARIRRKETHTPPFKKNPSKSAVQTRQCLTFNRQPEPSFRFVSKHSVTGTHGRR